MKIKLKKKKGVNKFSANPQHWIVSDIQCYKHISEASMYFSSNTNPNNVIQHIYKSVIFMKHLFTRSFSSHIWSKELTAITGVKYLWLHLKKCTFMLKFALFHVVAVSRDKNWLIDCLKVERKSLCESLLLIWSSYHKWLKMCKLAKWDTAGVMQLIWIWLM